MSCPRRSSLCFGLGIVAALAAPEVAAFDSPYLAIEGGQWDISKGPIVYHLEPNGSDDIDGSDDLNAVRDAFRAWTCVTGTNLRFKEDEEPGTKVADTTDGFNTVFWDETGAEGLGPATLGVNIAEIAQGGGFRTNGDIIFNGFDSQWSADERATAVDIGSIALHEIGHLIGLDHPCDKTANGQETNCNGSEQSIMTPVWGGGVDHYPFPDDEKGVLFLYPSDDPEQTCEGKRLLGEPCGCDGECVDELVCIPGVDGETVCARTCDAENSDCGFGFGCVLGPPAGDEVAPGACVKAQSGAYPAGAVCSARSNCADGDCSLVRSVGRSVCRTDCNSDGDCGELGACVDGACLISTTSTECPVDTPEGCGCQASSRRLPIEGVALLPIAWLVWRKRRTTRTA